MYETLTCLAFEHDHFLVSLAALICVLGAITSLRVLRLSMRETGSARYSWLAAAAVAGGGSVWSTHFIAMLAYDPGIVVGYAVWPIFSSLAAALVLTGAGFIAFMQNGRGMTFAGGTLVGIAIVALHYVGMTGIRVPGRMEWDSSLVAMSVVYSIAFSCAALYAIRRFDGYRGLYTASAALVTGVVLLHFTGMGALTIVPDPSVSMTGVISGKLLAISAAVITSFILFMAVVCMAFDVRLSRNKEESARRIRHMAYHDALTGLPNRAFLADEIQQRIEQADRKGEQLAILTLDLDRFKQINDLFGHATGDDVLRQLAEQMQSCLRSNEIVARVGGDEFVVIQSGVAQPDGAADLASRLLGAICKDMDIGGVGLRTGGSVGIALFPGDGKDASTLHPNADAALYRAKEEGRGTFRFFEAAMDLAQRERRMLQMEMRDALKRGEFKLYYQPQAETSSGVISGFEALLRWQHPQRGLISPVEFIPAAEDSGFIVELGEFVLREACAEAASWENPLNIGLNLSPVQFRHGDLAKSVEDVLAVTGLEPGRLELEITETVLIDDRERALEILTRIKALGVRVAMDDFGTGYSSLAYLEAFPFDRIKIDRSFIAKLQENHQSQAIIRAIIGLGQGLKVPVTAEGVETEEQQLFLAELECTEIQGFLVGRPEPIERFAMHTRRATQTRALRRSVA